MITAGTTEQIGNPSTALHLDSLKKDKKIELSKPMVRVGKSFVEVFADRASINGKIDKTKQKLQDQKDEANAKVKDSTIHSKYPSNFKAVQDVDEKIQRAKLKIQNPNTSDEKRAKEQRHLAQLKVEREQEWRKSFNKLQPRDEALLRKYINIINKAKREMKEQKKLESKTQKILDDYEKEMEAWGLAWFIANPTDLTLKGGKSAIEGMLKYNKILSSGGKGFEQVYNWIPTILKK